MTESGITLQTNKQTNKQTVTVDQQPTAICRTINKSSKTIFKLNNNI